MGAEIANFTGMDLGTQQGTLCFYSTLALADLVGSARLDGATYDPRSLRGQWP